MLSIDEAIDGLKRIFSNYELDLPCTDSLDIESEIIVMLEELKEYKATLLTPQMIKDLKKSEKQAHKTAIQNALLAEDSYKNAIDDFVKALQEKIEKDLANHDLALECKKCGIWKNYDIKEIAEQLKAGATNEIN